MDEKKSQEGRCKECGGRSPDNRFLSADSGDGKNCMCKRKSDSSIRLGPVPESAFRPPSPRISSKEEHTIAAAVGNTKYEIVSVREKHGEFRKAIPHMPMVVAIICCLFNVVLPGTGTFAAGLSVLCGCRTEHETKGRSLGYNAFAAVLQLITAPIVVGWVWSVLWGITFINVSASNALEDPNDQSAV